MRHGSFGELIMMIFCAYLLHPVLFMALAVLFVHGIYKLVIEFID